MCELKEVDFFEKIRKWERGKENQKTKKQKQKRLLDEVKDNLIWTTLYRIHRL